MTASVNTILALTAIAVGSTMILVTGVAQQPLLQTTKDSIKGQASVTTERLKGTVEYFEGNYLVVRTADGSYRASPPEVVSGAHAERRFLILLAEWRLLVHS